MMTATTEEAATSAAAKSSENASISFDWTIELNASADELEPSHSKLTIGPKTTMVAKQQHNMPLISPDDGSMAWDDVSISSNASKSVLGPPQRVRFQGITAFHPAAPITEEEERSMIDKLQHDISRQRSLRKRKEKALIKLARELTKRTEEVQQRNAKITEQTNLIHQLQMQRAENASSNNNEQEVSYLRKELLRLQLSNDRLRMSWSPQWSIGIIVLLVCWIFYHLVIE